MKSKFFFKAIPVLLVIVAGCTKDNIPEINHPLVLPESSSEVVTAQNKFAFELFKNVLKADPSPSNKLISPLSVYLDLSMVYNGAAGTTQTAMQQALQLDHINNNTLNATNQALITGLPSEDSKVTLSIANSIWYRNTVSQPLPAFLKINAAYYHARVTGADFSPATVAEINHWVANQTNQKIKTILEKIDDSDVMYLVNAVYFKGEWKYKFDSKQTQDANFYTTDQGIVQTPFMTQENTFNYFQNDSLQMIRLPYGNGDFNMYLLLPSAQSNISKLVNSLNENTMAQYISALDLTYLKILLPKWKYSYKIKDMKPELADMGMGIAFSKYDADFSNMYPPDNKTYISKVIHKTYVEVNEQGTEAAAVTAIGVGQVTNVSMPLIVNLDHPFLYVIAEKSSGTILFIGEMNNPAED